MGSQTRTDCVWGPWPLSCVEGVPPSKRGLEARDTQGRDGLATSQSLLPVELLHAAQGVVPKGVDLDGFAVARCKGYAVALGIHPRQLRILVPRRNQTVGVGVNAKVRPRLIGVDNPPDRRKQPLGKSVAGILPAIRGRDALDTFIDIPGGIEVLERGMDEPQRGIDTIELGFACAVIEATRDHPVVCRGREGGQHRPGFLVPTGGQQQAGEREKRIPAPVCKPRVSRDNGRPLAAAAVALDDELVGGQAQDSVGLFPSGGSLHEPLLMEPQVLFDRIGIGPSRWFGLPGCPQMRPEYEACVTLDTRLEESWGPQVLPVGQSPIPIDAIDEIEPPLRITLESRRGATQQQPAVGDRSILDVDQTVRNPASEGRIRPLESMEIPHANERTQDKIERFANLLERIFHEDRVDVPGQVDRFAQIRRLRAIPKVSADIPAEFLLVHVPLWGEAVGKLEGGQFQGWSVPQKHFQTIG